MYAPAATTAYLTLPGAVAHDTSAGTAWIDDTWLDLVLAEEDWVRREFDELIARGWGGRGLSRPPTSRGAHEPRRPTPRYGPTHHRSLVTGEQVGPGHRATRRSRSPPDRKSVV